MPENSSVERIKTMRALGAKITLTPASLHMEGAIDYVEDKINGSLDYFAFNQFANKSCVEAHFETTGPEIYEQTSKQDNAFHFCHGYDWHDNGGVKIFKKQK